MPKIWKYNLVSYLKGFFFALFCLTILPYLSRITKIAEYAALGASLKQFFLLLLIYIPYFLPFVFGLAALIAAFQTASNLSRNSELSAMRATGMSIFRIFLPIFYLSLLLSMLNFALISDWIPRTRYWMNNILLDETTINPLVLLKKQTFPHFEDAFIELKVDDNAAKGKDLLLITKPPNSDSLMLILSDKASFNKDKDLTLKNVNLISHMPSKEETYDHLLMDFHEEFTSPASIFGTFIYRNSSVNLYDVLPLSHLVGIHDKQARQEVLSRLAKSLFPMVLTYLGFIFGIFLKKNKLSDMIYAAALSIFYFLSFFIAKQLHATLLLEILAYLVPIIIIVGFTALKQYRIERYGS